MLTRRKWGTEGSLVCNPQYSTSCKCHSVQAPPSAVHCGYDNEERAKMDLFACLRTDSNRMERNVVCKSAPIPLGFGQSAIDDFHTPFANLQPILEIQTHDLQPAPSIENHSLPTPNHIAEGSLPRPKWTYSLFLHQHTQPIRDHFHKDPANAQGWARECKLPHFQEWSACSEAGLAIPPENQPNQTDSHPAKVGDDVPGKCLWFAAIPAGEGGWRRAYFHWRGQGNRNLFRQAANPHTFHPIASLPSDDRTRDIAFLEDLHSERHARRNFHRRGETPGDRGVWSEGIL